MKNRILLIDSVNMQVSLWGLVSPSGPGKLSAPPCGISATIAVDHNVMRVKVAGSPTTASTLICYQVIPVCACSASQRISVMCMLSLRRGSQSVRYFVPSPNGLRGQQGPGKRGTLYSKQLTILCCVLRLLRDSLD